MDQGIIRLFNAKYCAKAICKNINAINTNKELPNINILGGMIMLK